MEFRLSRITKPLDLGDYDERLRGQVLHVWVNPNKEFNKDRLRLLTDYAKYMKSIARNSVAGNWFQRFKNWSVLFVTQYYRKQWLEALHDMRNAWFSRLWSQHEDAETHCTVEEVKRLSIEEPALFEWLMKESVLLLDGFAADKKK